MNLRYNTITVLFTGKIDNRYAAMQKMINAWNEPAMKIKAFYEKIEWMTHDPMKQLNGSFNPESIDDLVQWYHDSGVYDL